MAETGTPIPRNRVVAPVRSKTATRTIIAPYGIRMRKVAGTIIGHFAAAAALALGANFYPSALWAYAALLLFSSFCFGLLRHSTVTFLLFVPLLALRITEFISGAAIESGAYMTETAGYGEATGAFTRLLLIYILFFGTATCVVEAMWPKMRRMFVEAPDIWERQAKVIWYGLLVIMGIGTTYLIRLGINNGFPLFTGADRFEYLYTLDSPYYSALLQNRLVIVPFIGVLFALPRYRIGAGAMIAWLLIASIVFGEKFTSLLMILSVFAVPAGLVHIANGRPIPLTKVLGIAAAIVVITVPAVFIAYGATKNIDAAAQRYGERVALQGQLWYRADQKYLNAGRFDDKAIASDIATWFKPGEQSATKVGTRFGLYYVMEKFTPSRTLGWTMETGNGFVFSLYPYLMMTMGLIGLLIVSSLLAFYHAWVMRMLAISLATPSWLASIAMGRVMSSFYATYSTGYLWNIFGIKTVLTIIIASILLWESRRSASVSRLAFERMAERLGANRGY
jgi:Family of unknown function (DUF6418)